MTIHKCLRKHVKRAPLNLVRGYCQVSRALAYESVALAEKCRGNFESMDSWLERGQAVADNIAKEQDKKYFLSELVSVNKG